MIIVKISMKKKDFTIPFDKVTIIDCDGNRQIIEAKEIIIESNADRFSYREHKPSCLSKWNNGILFKR